MSILCGRDGGRTQSGGVKGVITPGPGLAEPGRFLAACAACVCVLFVL